MQEISATYILPKNLSKAIEAAVNNSFKTAQECLIKKTQYPPYMNMKQASEYLGVSYNTIKKWFKIYPDFPVAIIDGSYHINREELDKFMLSMQNKQLAAGRACYIQEEMEVLTMFKKIDSKLLAYWLTPPEQRVWAYLATFVPLLGTVVGIANLL